MTNTCAIILAAGEGTRMKSNSPKVLSKVLFKPMIKWVLDALFEADINTVCTVCGYKHEILEGYLKNLNISLETVIQTQRRGTAHAVICANEFLQNNIDKDVLILGGDSPFIDAVTIKESFNAHKKGNNVATIISADVKNPFGYGRIVRDAKTKKVTSIIEQKDADDKTKLITEVNSGAYWFNVKALLGVIYNISNENKQGEFYLPDAIKLLLNKNLPVEAYVVQNENIILGANDRIQLGFLNELAREKVLCKLMSNGVDIPFKDGIIIESQVEIGKDTCILPGTVLTGKTKIGSNCTVGPNVELDNCTLHSGAKVHFCYGQNQTFS